MIDDASVRNLSARVGVYMDVREREREGVGGGLDGRCVNGMRWMMMTTTQGGGCNAEGKGRERIWNNARWRHTYVKRGCSAF